MHLVSTAIDLQTHNSSTTVFHIPQVSPGIGQLHTATEYYRLNDWGVTASAVGLHADVNTCTEEHGR